MVGVKHRKKVSKISPNCTTSVLHFRLQNITKSKCRYWKRLSWKYNLWSVQSLYPRLESNQYLILRRDLFYPLNYRGNIYIYEINHFYKRVEEWIIYYIFSFTKSLFINSETIDIGSLSLNKILYTPLEMGISKLYFFDIS